MRALPKISGTVDSWRSRAERKERAKESASFERRCLQIVVARQIRSEIRDERKQGKS